MRLSHLNALRALESTLRLGSFTAAARELGITPAAVGQRVRTLEDYLGKELFVRTSTGIAAREQATRVSAPLTAGFTAVASALEQLRQPAVENRLAVTLPASFAEHWLTPHISEFYRRHSEVDLRLDASNRNVDLLQEDFDFALRYGPRQDDPLEEQLLFGDAVLPVCSPAFAERQGIGPECRSLEGIPLIHVLDRTGDPGWVGFDGWAKAFGFDPAHLDHGARYSRVTSGLQAAVSGQGLVMCGLAESFNALRAGLLVAPFGPALRLATGYSYRLVWVRDRPMIALQQDFRSWILEKSRRYAEEISRLFDVQDVR